LTRRAELRPPFEVRIETYSPPETAFELARVIRLSGEMIERICEDGKARWSIGSGARIATRLTLFESPRRGELRLG